MKKYKIECTPDFQTRLQELIDFADGETEICFAPGIYQVRGSIRLSPWNEGLRFTSEGGAMLCGAMPMTDWHPITEEMCGRFHPSVQDRVVYCELQPGEIQPFRSRGAMRGSSVGASELIGDVPMQIARYPRQGYSLITGVGKVADADEWGAKDGELENGFVWQNDRVQEWSPENDIWALGYWKYDWANSLEQVESFDCSGHFQMKPPYGWYGYRIGQRVCFYNITEEIREPGDYVLDTAQNRIYLYPAGDLANIRMSNNSDPLFWLEEAANITIENLYLGDTCGAAIEAIRCDGLHIDRCHFDRIGSCAVCIVDGHAPVMENCTVHRCGDGGVVMSGGDRCTLEPMNGRIFNNHFYDIGCWGKCYFPAIAMSGVGIEASRNLIHDCPHTAIMYWGNEIKITDNEVYRVVLETGDSGAIYAGRDLTFRGNEVSHNYIHHLGAGVGIGTMGIYNDDTLCGTKMCDNFFEEVTRAIQLGGGRDFIVRNNVFVKCAPAVHFDSRSADIGTFWEEGPRTTLMDRFYRITRYVRPYGVTDRCQNARMDDGRTVSAMDSEYIRRYPELEGIDELYRNQIDVYKRLPGQALVENNIFMSRVKFRYRADDDERRAWDRGQEIPYTDMLYEYVESPRWDLKRGIAGTVGELEWNNNLQGEKADFADVDWSDLQVNRTQNVYQHRHMPANFSAIGLMEQYRANNPLNIRTRVEYIPGSGTAKIGIRNRSAQPASGTLYFMGSRDICAAVDKLDFAVNGQSDAWYEIPVRGSHPDGVLEVYSTIPGVRPARSI
ncbi:MAG: right-handed parallel beta-helix repeat-containing protein [Clostridia bacterium]|nr:right-handed parallel beta-helix repeat-containing protein [Clostridia bacterium]